MKRTLKWAALGVLWVLGCGALASCGGSALSPTALFWSDTGGAPPVPPSLEPSRLWDASTWT